MGNGREKVWGKKEVDDWGGLYEKELSACLHIYFASPLNW